ncbi:MULTISPECIES: signal peptide peptidase SppA [unclassified Undibacterium]|uniref:signal peptide peptidase SppA n=2 Tax=Pseudomonadota TaxID=1224 RepID=UPI002AC9C853|nr:MULTISPECIES: signal peptide peptidase SppA [unclassified Undibacterium]MEB0139785.1 signal peptide peptidase SppA [Undibacterium sp. CCC2.1]MEB0170507.1 signal peptide peptidase SppA [Undibacterium sp. CCC1.1]MEB0174448.1 signal peptide peptidase SppA [Undibacterium sp. CCC3.4]MEB0213755.1 signal peptide peptidase SppA [Undibacterium sp. 5I2]WPX43918.1 signal peptide peptidase SppA [Undibacterium sp. CCC3.4]
MNFPPFRWIAKGLSWLWRALDVSRRILLNLLVLALLIAIAIALLGGGSKKLEEKTILILDLKGALVEQHSGSTRDVLLAEAQGTAKKTIQLRDILTVLESAASDNKISGVVLLLDDMGNAGLPILRETGAALERFKKSGKTVVAWGSSYDQRQYFLAAHANEIYLHPMGAVFLSGFGKYRNYYHDALDKVGITVNLLKVGTYKSFAEPYIANAPSPAASEAESFLYNAMWKTYTSNVEQARKLPAGSIMHYIDEAPELLTAAGDDAGKMALNLKLIDALKTRDELRAMMLKHAGKDEENHTFRQITFDDYLARQKPKLIGPAIGVIVASGEISDGMAPPGAIGGLSTANLIRKAREDANIKALVLRIDSPGGSAFGSELIRRELELTRAAGKPVVVSMGNLAASGGYWISMASDEVIADEASITGSIGVFAILPTADKAIDKLGIHTAGTTTTWLADPFNPLRPLNPRFAQLIQGSINHIYADFTGKAALARKTTPAKIDAVAQGRVWTGAQARERGLVDTVGSYGDALKSAALRAKIGDNYRVSYIEQDLSKFDRLFDLIGARAAGVLEQQFKLTLIPSGIPPAAAAQIGADFLWLADLNKDGKGYMAITHCLCTAP